MLPYLQLAKSKHKRLHLRLTCSDNLESWLSQQDWSVPGSGFGPGVGDFLGLSAENGDLSMLPETW